MDEFALIDIVLESLGDRAHGKWVVTGPGDDSAVIDVSAGHQLVASIDTLIADVHFPASAPAQLVGYRAMMVALSDLAAMAATPRYVLVALNLEAPNAEWCAALARGMRRAAEEADVYVCGGNFARGPLAISVSVHGEVPRGRAVHRHTAQVGDRVYVSGALGGAAACVREHAFAFTEPLNPQQVRYMCPSARFDLIDVLRGDASAAIDISDGLAQDLGHVGRASGVRINIDTARLPLYVGADLDDALYGGDDYEIACTSAGDMPGFVHIGEVASGEGVWIDGAQFERRGYDHFGA